MMLRQRVNLSESDLLLSPLISPPMVQLVLPDGFRWNDKASSCVM